MRYRFRGSYHQDADQAEVRYEGSSLVELVDHIFDFGPHTDSLSHSRWLRVLSSAFLECMMDPRPETFTATLATVLQVVGGFHEFEVLGYTKDGTSFYKMFSCLEQSTLTLEKEEAGKAAKTAWSKSRTTTD